LKKKIKRTFKERYTQCYHAEMMSILSKLKPFGIKHIILKTKDTPEEMHRDFLFSIMRNKKTIQIDYDDDEIELCFT